MRQVIRTISHSDKQCHSDNQYKSDEIIGKSEEIFDLGCEYQE